MVDAVGTITKIVEVGLKIKRAADMVKQNEDLCNQIKDRVEILSITLSQHQDNARLMNNLAVRAALEALDRTLGEALNLVMECQQETNCMCLLYTAGNLSQQLINVEQRISYKNMDAMFAIMSFILPKEFNQGSYHPPSQQVYSSGRQGPSKFQAMQPPSPPKQMWRQNQDGGDGNVQTYDNLPGTYFLGRPENRVPKFGGDIFNRARAERLASNEANSPVPEVDPATRNSQWDSSVVTLCSCCAMVEKRKPVRRPSFTPDGRPRSLLLQIAEVALDVKKASETVLQHKQDCIEIDKRASTVSGLLSQLENTEIVEKQAMKDELRKLLWTLYNAHTLVMTCQRSGIVTMLLCSPPCKLSKQLSDLLDQLVAHVNAIIAVIVNSTLRPQRNRYTRTGNVSGESQVSRSIQPARSMLPGNVGVGENNDASSCSGARGDAPVPARVIPRLGDHQEQKESEV